MFQREYPTCPSLKIMWIRLRQIAVTTEDLRKTAADLQTVLGVEPCYTDPAVGVFGLKNVLWPIGTQFLECVTPMQPETTAGRYQQRRGGDTGYMLVAEVDDADARRSHIDSLGIRLVHEMETPNTKAMQLHPGDTGGSFIEMDQVMQGAAIGPDGKKPGEAGGPWGPAGPFWQPYVCTDVVSSISAAELQSPDPQRLAQRWSQIIEIELGADDAGNATIQLDNATLRFVEETDGRGEGMGGIDVTTVDRESVLDNARARGCYVSDDRVDLAGLRVYLRD